MNDASENRASDGGEPLPPMGRVLPFGKPQNALQQAVQARAQEQVERQLQKPKPEPLRRVVTFCVALVPVLLLLGAVDVVVRGIHMLVTLRAKMPVEQSAPQPVEQPQIEQQPGVIMLVPSQGSESRPAPSPEE